jgi:hypothetical protein
VALESLHLDLDRIAQAVDAAAPAALHPCRGGVELEVIAGQTTRRQEAFEDIPEAHEEAAPDQTDDLALPRLLPAVVEELLVEQPGGAELVRQVLDLGGLALLRRRVLGELVEVFRERLVGDAELAEQCAMDDEIRIAPDRLRLRD